MVAETRSPGVSTRDRRRVKTQGDAAAFLGISPQRLQEMRRIAPWWAAVFSNEDGWDIVGIAVAQCQYHEDRVVDNAGSVRKQEAELQKLEEEAQIKRLDRQKRERVEAETAGLLVRVEVVQSLLSEALGELRRLIDDVPFSMSQQVPPEVLPFVFVDETTVQEISRLSVLQRLLLRVTESYQRWLDRVPEEVFDGVEEEAVA